MVIWAKVLKSNALHENRFSAEFFDPKYVFKPKAGYKWVKIGRVINKAQYGLSISMNEKGKGFPIFRMNEIDNCFATKASKYADISQEEYKIFKLNENDVLFNRTNSFEFVGRTSIVKSQTNSVFASYLIRVVPDSSRLLPEYLTVYLNTAFGIGQIKRRAMPSINQANVSASELKRIQILIPDMDIQREIRDLLNLAYNAMMDAESLYTQAQKLLDQELGINKTELEMSIGCKANLDNIMSSHRIDAQHYLIKHQKLINQVKSKNSVLIKDIRIYNRRGVQPIYMKEGDINVVNSQHIGKDHLDYDNLQKTTHAHFTASPLAHIQQNDLLIYTTGAYIGLTNVYLSSQPALASNHVNILRLKNGIDAAYMALVMQSIVGKFQTEKHARGSAQAELYPADIDKFIVPLLLPEKQKEIGDLICDSLLKKHESQKLIDQAKRQVEELIEQAVGS